MTAIALGAFGCGTPQPSGVLVISIPGEPSTTFPPHVRSSAEIAVASQIYLKLADVGPSLNTVGDSGFVPELAASWTFRDSVTLAFTLDPDAQWHDGVPVSARDVAFTLDVYRDTLVGASVASLLSRIASVETEGDRTVVFRFTTPYPGQFYDAAYHLRILPAHRLDTIPRGSLRGHPAVTDPVGTGPYRLARRLQGELIQLEAVPNWWGTLTGAERVVFRVTPDLETAISQLVAGESQVVEALPTPDNYARVAESETAVALDYPSAVYMYLGFNLRSGPLANPRVRQALLLATDRSAIIEAALGGRGVVPPGPTTPTVWIADGAPVQPPANPAEARRILDSLGYGGSRMLSFDIMYPSSSGLRERMAVILEQQFREVGVRVRLVPLEFNTFVERSTQGRFDALLGGWQVSLLPEAMRELWGSEAIGGSNYGAYASARFDSLVAAAATARVPAVARSTWHAALAQINEDVPAIWLASPRLAAGIGMGLENVTIRPDNWAATLREWRPAH